MTSNLLQILTTNWHFARFLRLGFALWIGYSAITSQQPIFFLLAGIFVFQAITNTGCCGASGCAAPSTAKPTDEHSPENPVEITYEEVK
jgi:hypothetical protein